MKTALTILSSLFFVVPLLLFFRGGYIRKLNNKHDEIFNNL